MKLYYHKDLLGNFGDDLNPIIWEKYFPGCFDGYLYHIPKLRVDSSFDDLFLGIGTILNNNIPKEGQKFVFGSGYGYGEKPKIDKSWTIYFVRGPRTAAALGLPSEKAITDPAILTQFLDLGAVFQKYDVSFIPHCSTARSCDWRSICDTVGIHYIDPQNEVMEVLRDIKSSGRIITEAMHGAIIADTFRIPWLPVKSTNNILDIKWLDWCESLNITYAPNSLPSFWNVEQKNPSFIKNMIGKSKRFYSELNLKSAKNSTSYLLSNIDTFNASTDRVLSEVDHFKKHLLTSL